MFNLLFSPLASRNHIPSNLGRSVTKTKRDNKRCKPFVNRSDEGLTPEISGFKLLTVVNFRYQLFDNTKLPHCTSSMIGSQL